MLFKLFTPFSMFKILTQHLEEFYHKLTIDTHDLNPPIIMVDNKKARESKTAKAEKVIIQEKKCLPSKLKGKKSRTR